MPTEDFTLREFEAALPKHKDTNQLLWRSKGLVNGEYVFYIPVKDHVQITIRSSVKENGMAAPTGEDSIRVWVSDEQGKPYLPKKQRWVCRTKNWRDTLTDLLRASYRDARMLKACPKCNMPLVIKTVKKEGPTKGRFFSNCCNNFNWETVTI